MSNQENAKTAQPQPKKKPMTFVKKTGIFQFNLMHDTKTGRDSLVGFRITKTKEKTSSFRIVLRREADLYCEVIPGEFWLVEYHESDDAKFAYATPIARPKMRYELMKSVKNGEDKLGIRIFVEADGQDATLLLQMFPDNRKYDKEFIETLLDQKIQKFDLQLYGETLKSCYRDVLQSVANNEKEAMEATQEAIKIIQDMDEEKVEGKKEYMSVVNLTGKILKSINLLDENAPDPAMLAVDAIEKFNIKKFDSRANAFVIAK